MDHGLVMDTTALSWYLDSILRVFSNLDDSMVLSYGAIRRKHISGTTSVWIKIKFPSKRKCDTGKNPLLRASKAILQSCLTDASVNKD